MYNSSPSPLMSFSRDPTQEKRKKVKGVGRRRSQVVGAFPK